MLLLDSVHVRTGGFSASFIRGLTEGTKTTGNNYNLLKTMCDFVCEKPFLSRTDCQRIKSGSRLERAKGIEPS